MKVMNFVLPILLLSTLISGCGSTPYSKEIWMNPDRVSIDSEAEKQRVGYLARYLMPKEEAVKLDSNIRSSEWANENLLISTAGFTGSLLQTGNPLSTAGVNASAELTAALTVASWLIPDSSIMEKVSGIYLPKEWEGKPIETATQAKKIAIEHTENQLRKAAEQHGLSYECIANCASMMSRVYHLDHTETANLDGYVYKAPGGVYVVSHWLDLVQPEKSNPVENAAVGFDIGWMSPPGNTWVVGFYGTPLLDENGKMPIKEGENGFVYPAARHDLKWTELGLSLHKSFSDDGGYLFMGSEDQTPDFVAYNGKLYSYISTRADSFIEYELIPAVNEVKSQ